MRHCANVLSSPQDTGPAGERSGRTHKLSIMSDPSELSDDDLTRARRFARPVAEFMSRWRGRIREYRWLDIIYRAFITLVGALIVVVGIILIPLPGPGWLIVFIGLTVLGSEWHWARRLTQWVKNQLARFWRIWNTWRAERREKKAAKLARREEKQRHRQADRETKHVMPRTAEAVRGITPTQKLSREY